MNNKYTPTTWVGSKTVATADVMNNIEKGVKDAHDRLDGVDTLIDDISINVKKYGAKGDGITDDDVAIQIADSKGGVLFFPPGEYILTNPPASKCYGNDAMLITNGGYRMVLDSKPLEVNSFLQSDNTRLNNTDLGINAGKKLTPNDYGNVAIGNNALKDATEFTEKDPSTNEDVLKRAVKNIAIGHNALNEANWLYHNVVIGVDACRNTTMGERNTVVGNNTALGMGDSIIVGRNHMFRSDVDTKYLDDLWSDWRGYAGQPDSPSSDIIPTKRDEVKGNTAIGRNALGWTTRPMYCTAVGYNALEKALAGNGTVSIGVNSAYNTIKSNNSVVVGMNANTYNSTSNGDVSLGYGAMNSVPHSDYNVAIGYQALYGANTARGVTISDNIAIGRFALANTQGAIVSNVSVGASALRYNQGNFNTAIGQQASQDNTTGGYNTSIGCNAGRSLTTATKYTALGYNALNNATMDGFTNITGVGQNSTVSDSNQVQLGNSQATPYAFNALQLRSDRRDKMDIEDVKLGLDFINKLKPVEYRMNIRESYVDYDEEGNAIEVENDGSRSGKRKHMGLIAQDVKSVLDEMNVDYSFFQHHSVNGGKDVMSLSYEELISPLIKSIQELTSRVCELEAQLQK